MTGLRHLSPDDLRRWGRHTHGSPFYGHLIEVISSDEELMRIINRIEHVPRPNVLLAGVQFMLMDGADDELAAFYPGLVDNPSPMSEVGKPFTRFVRDHETELVAIGRSRYTQTNECRRCVALLPGIWETGVDRFHLIDVGTSAGLNLAIDRFHYRWGDLEWGDPNTITLTAESKGRDPNPSSIEILSRTGLDLNPVDVDLPEERRWLDALIWPEHFERRQRLHQALVVARALDATKIAGNALETLSVVLGDLPGSEPVVVMHSFALNQFSPAQRQQVGAILESARVRRPVHRVSYEFIDKNDDWAKLGVDSGDGYREVGQGHPHGEWIELYALP